VVASRASWTSTISFPFAATFGVFVTGAKPSFEMSTLCGPSVTRISAATGLLPIGFPSSDTSAPASLTRMETYPVCGASSFRRACACALEWVPMAVP